MTSETSQSCRKYSARMFSRERMVCPRCKAGSRQPAESCGRCGFSFHDCEKAFPFAPPPLALVIDPAGLLPAGVQEDLEGAYRKVRKRFPQIGFSFCFVRLAAGVATQEFAFWLHNSAPAADEARAWEVLVVGDLTEGRLALTVGYALEPFIRCDEWEAALQELAACIADEQWKEGLNGFLADARALLTAAWTTAEQRRRTSRRKSSAEESPESSSAKQPEAAPPEPPPKTRSDLPPARTADAKSEAASETPAAVGARAVTSRSR